jgi:hypothetical protein
MERESEKGGESDEERGGENDEERERERERERDVEYGRFIFIFKRNDRCLGTF